MNPYYFFILDGRDSGAMVVFESTARRARLRGFKDWPGDDEYIHARAIRLNGRWRVFAEQDGPHSVDWYSEPVETWEEALALRLNHAEPVT